MRTPSFAALRRRLAEPVDGASLAALRVAFGVVMAAAVVRFAAMGWIDELYVRPGFHFHYWGFEWVRPLPAPWIHLHFAALGVAAAMVALGLYYRVAILAFSILFLWVELLDPTTYLNHYYAISLVGLLLVASPAHRIASVDAWLARRRGSPLPSTVPTAAVWMLRAQLGCVYLFAGVAKLNADWLFHAEPLRTWLLARSEMPVLGPLLEREWVAYAMSWAGALFDLSVPFLLIARRTRPWAYVAVVGFHAMTGALFQIGMFPWIMVLLTSIFFDTDWPRRLSRRARALAPAEARPDGGTARLLSPPVVLAMSVWIAIQIVLPLRHHLYAGDVLWTQEGMRWAWHVMIAERGGIAELAAIDEEGRRWVIDPHETLSPLQVQMMSCEPDLILQFAHHVRDEFAARGRRVHVHANVWVAVNGRRSGRLVDPSVDLAAEHGGLDAYDWIEPRPER